MSTKQFADGRDSSTKKHQNCSLVTLDAKSNKNIVSNLALDCELLLFTIFFFITIPYLPQKLMINVCLHNLFITVKNQLPECKNQDTICLKYKSDLNFRYFVLFSSKSTSTLDTCLVFKRIQILGPTRDRP